MADTPVIKILCFLCEIRDASYKPTCSKCSSLLPHISIQNEDQMICYNCRDCLVNTFRKCGYHVNCRVCPFCPPNPCEKCGVDTCVTNTDRCQDCKKLICRRCYTVKNRKYKCLDCIKKYCTECYKLPKMEGCLCQENHPWCYKCYLQTTHKKCTFYTDIFDHDKECSNTLPWKGKSYSSKCILRHLENQEKKIYTHNENKYRKRISCYPCNIQDMILSFLKISHTDIAD